MDLDEYALTEAQRMLKRLGVSHLWRQTEPATGAIAVAPSDSAPPGVPEPSRTRGAPSAPEAASRPEAALPAILRALFHGKQSPVRTLWTYAGLYADLQMPVAPPRLEMLRKIQSSARSHLGWRETDICAWPLDVPPELFFQGVRFFVPATVIAFGTGPYLPACADTEPAGSILRQCALYVLPSLEDMAAGNQQSKNEAWQILQSIRI